MRSVMNHDCLASSRSRRFTMAVHLGSIPSKGLPGFNIGLVQHVVMFNVICFVLRIQRDMPDTIR